MISKNELALMGARSHLIDLNKRRLELLRMFPELDIEEELKPTKVVASSTKPPVGASGRRLVKNGGAFRVWEYMTKNPGTYSAKDLAAALGMKQSTAYTSVGQLVAQKLATRVGRGVFKLR